MFKKLALTLIVSIAGMNFVSCVDNVVLTAQEEKTVATIEKNIEKVQLSKEEQASVKKFIAKHKSAVIAITSLVTVGLVGGGLVGFNAKCKESNVPGLAWMSNSVVSIVNAAITMARSGFTASWDFGAKQVKAVNEHKVRTAVISAAVLAVAGVAVYYYATKISKKANKKQDVTPVVKPA